MTALLGASKRRVVTAFALGLGLSLTLAVPVQAADYESRGGYKACSKGYQLQIISEGTGRVVHKFSEGLIGSGDAKVFNHAFGRPYSGDTNVTKTWRRGLYWQVRMYDTQYFNGDIGSVDVGCTKIRRKPPADKGYVVKKGSKSCKKGQYVWLGTKYIQGKPTHRFAPPGGKAIVNSGSTFGEIAGLATPTWRRSVTYTMWFQGHPDQHKKAEVWCSSKSGGSYD
jgi:hypothetical protein